MAEIANEAQSEAPANDGYGSAGYRAYVLFALIVVYTFNFIDRTLIGVLGEPIRETFGLSDTMIGLLSGLAFALLYTILGIPFAMLAERKNRTTIIAIAMAAWSGMTVLCGMAQNTLQFALARVGVGIGEAGCSPPSHSLISDYFPPEKRSSALGIFALGIPIGSMLAAVGGAWIANQDGLNWRDAFIWMGLPGVLGAVIFKMTVKEPPRGYSDPGGAEAAAQRRMPSPFKVFSIIGRNPSFWHVSLGGAIASFVGYGVGQFVAPFWIRVHGLELFEAALLYGGLLGIAAGIGTIGSGIVADRLRARYPNADSWVPALGMSLCVPVAIIGYNTVSFAEGTAAIWMAVPFLALAAILRYAYLAPMFSVTQKLVEPRMRATAAALMLFVVNLIGYGAGPPAIGFISDTVSKRTLVSMEAPLTLNQCGGIESQLKAVRDGRETNLSEAELAEALATNAEYCAPARKNGVRWAISIGFLFLFWAAAHFLLMGRTMQRDLWTPDETPATA
ncbi:MAG: MFS transporter [Hyphomonadaceae bacterium]|nr:MFS transporter [Hyphomonadaceae bacterium]